MLTTHVHEGENLVEIDFGGALEADEMIACRQALQAVIAEHGNVRLLVRYGELHMTHSEPRAFWEDLKNASLIPHIERCAIVAHQRWLRTLSEVAGALVPTRIKTFDLDAEAEAAAWIGAHSTSSE